MRKYRYLVIAIIILLSSLFNLLYIAIFAITTFLGIYLLQQLLIDQRKVLRRTSYFIIAYLLISFNFALAFSLLGPQYFHFSVSNENIKFIDYLYYSFITISTIGYGDIYPTKSLSKILTMFEILLGLLTISLGIGYIVSSKADKHG